VDYRAFDDNSMRHHTTQTEQHSPETPSRDLPNKGRAVVDLLHHRILIHSFGEYEVRTTIATRQAWRYRSSIWRRGKEIKREFYPIVVDRSRQMRQAAIITEEMRLQFAMEAVDIHFARCAALQQHLKTAPLYAPPPPDGDTPGRLILVALLCALVLLAYWFWSSLPTPPPVPSPPSTVRWEQSQVSYELPAGKRFALPLPALISSPAGIPVEVSLDPSSQQPNWLHFARDTLMISGRVPRSDIHKTFLLTFRAKAGQEHESPLQVLLKIAR
jgi:hypothetical protein